MTKLIQDIEPVEFTEVVSGITLREVLPLLDCTVRIVNDLGEDLIEISKPYQAVCSMNKFMSEELLSRAIAGISVATDTLDGCLRIVLEGGEDDAE